MGSQVIGEDQSRLPGRGTVRKVERRKARDRTKERVHRFNVGFERERRASRLPCKVLVLAMTDDVCREAEV